MKTIFLVIPHYVFTSDLLRTKYIEYLSEKYRVVVFTSMIGPEEARQRNYFSSPNVIYVQWNLENPKFWSIFKFLRIALIGEFDYLASVKYFYHRPNYVNNFKRRMLRNLFWPITKILKASWFTAVERLFLPKSEKFLSYIKEFQPSLLVTATPGFDAVESELILLAKKSEIPSVAVNFTWDNLTMNCKHIRKTDYLVAWNEVMKKEAINIHKYKPEQVFVSGTPRFDPYFDRSDSKNSNTFELSEKKEIVEKELSYKLGGVFFEIQKELGRFCRERQYADALAEKLEKYNIKYKREFPIEIAGRKSNFADFIVEDKIIVELKSKPFVVKEDYYQSLRYLEALDLDLALLVNFRSKYLKPKRVLNYKKYSSKLESFEWNSDISNRMPSREDFLKSKGLNPDYPTIFHTTVTRAYTFQKKYIQDLINLRNDKKIPYVNLFFRTHPLDDLETYKEFFGLKDIHFEGAGKEIVSPDGKKKVEMSYQDLLNLKYSLKYTDVNVNYASTITIEACIFDKPVINIGYLGVYTFAYGFTHYEPIYKSGAVRLVKKDEELAEFINMYLKDPSIDRAARQKIVSDYVQFTDGLSYKRSVDFIGDIIYEIRKRYEYTNRSQS